MPMAKQIDYHNYICWFKVVVLTKNPSKQTNIYYILFTADNLYI